MSMDEFPRTAVRLPVGFRDPESGKVFHEAEVRPVIGADEYYIGRSSEYQSAPTDLVYKTLLLARTVRRLGPRTMISISDIQRLHAKDLRALEHAVYRITYGDDAVALDDNSD